jgi:hypothetical protein
LFAALFLFVSSLGAQAATATPDLASYDWSVSAKPNLAAKPPPEEVVRSFVTKRYSQPDIGVEPLVNSFAFADLRQSGTVSLVVSMEPTGPAGCGQLLIVDKVGGKFEGTWISCGGSDNIGKSVIEISGKPVVVTYTDITPYYGAQARVVYVPVIWGWNGSSYVDMSRQFPGYYRQVLRGLQHEIASSPASADYARGPVRCEKIEADAIERFLGISPDAGIEDAIRWSQSSKPIDRIMAMGLFTSIGTPRALDYLKAMTSDSDPQVARAAEGNLNALNSRGSAEDPVEKLGHLKVYMGPP